MAKTKVLTSVDEHPAVATAAAKLADIEAALAAARGEQETATTRATEQDYWEAQMAAGDAAMAAALEQQAVRERSAALKVQVIGRQLPAAREAVIAARERAVQAIAEQRLAGDQAALAEYVRAAERFVQAFEEMDRYRHETRRMLGGKILPPLADVKPDPTVTARVKSHLAEWCHQHTADYLAK